MTTGSQDTMLWPSESTLTRPRYYPVDQTQADLDSESTRLFASDDSRRDSGEIPVLEACKVDSHGSMHKPLSPYGGGIINQPSGSTQMYSDSRFPVHMHRRYGR